MLRSHAPGRVLAAILIGLFALAALPAGGPPPRVGAAPAPSLPQPDHVVVVMEENHSFASVIGNPAAPYINALAGQGALFTNAHGVEHPSQPNYLDLFAGDNQGITDDSCPRTLAGPNLASELLAAGRSFAGYAEGLPAPGSLTCVAGAYARKHAPWVDAPNLPASVNLPWSRFPTDYSQLPTVAFVIPNVIDDMHDGSVRQGDAWLQAHLAAYVAWAWTHNSLLIVHWDEDEGSAANHIPTLLAGPMVVPGRYAERITHFSILRTLEDLYHLPYAGQSANLPPIADVWGGGHTFPETGHTVSGRFQQYWQDHGGLAQQGYPLSDALPGTRLANGQVTTVQYFERAVFEWHPENAPPYDVLLTALGTARYRQKYGAAGAPGQRPNTQDARLFPETGHRVGGLFLRYWDTHGGLAQQGFPLSEEFTETSDLDGRPYTVQYFERAVFEWHPANAPPYDVLLAQLGTLAYRAIHPAGP